MMYELVFDGIVFVPFFIERFCAFFIGIGLFFHFLEMANFAHPKSPMCVGITLASIGFSSVGLTISAVAGNMGYLWNFALGSAGAVLALWLLLWYKGLHVSEFLQREYGDSAKP